MASYQVNEKLSFDVLGLIFAHYADEENIDYPLETLLLVCRAWNTAALGHQTLWNNLRIYFWHTSIYNVWKTRLPLRLARCGPTIPLDIDLRNCIETAFHDPMESVNDNHISFQFTCPLNTNANKGEDCGCRLVARVLVKNALHELTGKDGRLCARWRSLKLGLGYAHDERYQVTSALRYPTPILKSLRLEGTLLDLPEAKFPVLPSTPMLNSITVLGCTVPSLPDMQSVRHLQVGWPCSFFAGPNPSNFGNATHLRTLSLRFIGQIDLPIPSKLEYLSALHIEGNDIPTDLFSCDMPQVTELVLCWYQGCLPLRIRDFDGLRVENLQILGLVWYPDSMISFPGTMNEWSDMKMSLFWLLTRARDLQQLRSTADIIGIVVKILWVALCLEDQAKLFPWRDLSFQGAWLVDGSTGRRVKIGRQVDKAFLENLAEKWDLSHPTFPDPTLIDLFLGSQNKDSDHWAFSMFGDLAEARYLA